MTFWPPAAQGFGPLPISGQRVSLHTWIAGFRLRGVQGILPKDSCWFLTTY